MSENTLINLFITGKISEYKLRKELSKLKK